MHAIKANAGAAHVISAQCNPFVDRGAVPLCILNNPMTFDTRRFLIVCFFPPSSPASTVQKHLHLITRSYKLLMARRALSLFSLTLVRDGDQQSHTSIRVFIFPMLRGDHQAFKYRAVKLSSCSHQNAELDEERIRFHAVVVVR